MNIMEATRLALSGQLEVDSNSVLTESIERPKKLINNNLKKENVEIKADNTEIKIDDDKTEVEVHPDDKKCDVCPECGCNPCVCDKEDDSHEESDEEEPKEDIKSVLEAKADKILEDEEKPGNAYAQPNGTITDSKTGEILDPGVVEESDDKEEPDEGEIPEEDSVEEKSDKKVELPSIDVDIDKVKEAAKILNDIINAVDDKEEPDDKEESKKIVKESWDAQPGDSRVHALRVAQLVDEGLVSWEDIGEMLVNTLMSDDQVNYLLRDDLYEMTGRDIDDDSDGEDNDLDESKNISLKESRILTHKRIIKEALKRKQNENK